MMQTKVWDFSFPSGAIVFQFSIVLSFCYGFSHVSSHLGVSQVNVLKPNISTMIKAAITASKLNFAYRE